MTAPNLKTPTSILGRTAAYSVTDTLAAALANSSGSGKVLKVDIIRAANVHATDDAVASVTFYRSSADTYLARDFAIPVNTTLVFSDKNEFIYLEEGDSIRAVADAASKVALTISYEEIS